MLKLKTPYRNGATHIVMSPMQFMQRLAAQPPIAPARRRVDMFEAA